MPPLNETRPIKAVGKAPLVQFGGPRAKLVTEDGRIFQLSHTPTESTMTNLALISAEIERPGIKPLLQRDRKGLVTLEFTHTEVGIGGLTVDAQLQKYALLASSGYALRLSAMSGLEGRYWWIITDFQVKVVQRNHNQKITAAECSWRFKEAVPQFPPVGDPTPRPAVTSPAGTSTGTTSYTVKVGDSLWAIAAKLLGSGGRYSEIAKLNNLANPNTLAVGTVLKIPAR